MPAFDCCWHSICLLTKICWRMLQGLVNMNYSCDAKKSCYPSFFRYAHINASGILLCSVCSQIGEASFKHCFASLFQTAIMSMCSRCGWRNHVVHPSTRLALHICRVGQNHIYIYIYIYSVYIRYFWLGNHQIYGVYICTYTVLANPTYLSFVLGVKPSMVQYFGLSCTIAL